MVARAALLTLTLLAGIAAPASASAAPACTSTTGKTLYQAGHVRVYRDAERTADGARKRFACVLGRRGRVRVTGDAAAWRSSGGFLVGWLRYDAGGGPSPFDAIWLYDVARQRFVRKIPIPEDAAFTDPLVTSDGSVAYVFEEIRSGAVLVRREVRLARAGQPEHTLDTGLAIDRDSLAATATPEDVVRRPRTQTTDLLFWRNGDDPRSVAVTPVIVSARSARTGSGRPGRSAS